MNRSHALFARIALLIVLPITCFAQPAITKIEPPNWWTKYPRSPMLLLYGTGLQAAQVSTRTPGVKILRTEPQPDGKHTFVWLDVSGASAGDVRFTVTAGGREAAFTWPLLARENPAGKFQGISPDDVLYLAMPDRFANGDVSNDNPAEAPGQTDRKQERKWHGGDLKGVAARLDYLKDLGITSVWLTPWWKQNTTTSDYHGYHVVDFYAVEPHLGTMRDLRQLVAEAHRRGMKIIIDYVVNHTGPEHPWAANPPTATWLHGTPARHIEPQYDFAQLIDPHAVPRQYRPVLEGWFANRLPDLNVDDPRVTGYLIDNALWWTEITGLDGYRLDTFPYSSRSFWGKWHAGVFAVYPTTWTVGEVLNGDPWITSFFVGGRKQAGIDTGLTTVFDFPVGFAIDDVLNEGASAKKIVEALQKDSLYDRPGHVVSVIGNHDIQRFLTAAKGNHGKLKAAMALQLTMRGIPQIYSGDEIAMQGGNDPDNRRDFPGGFPGDQQSAFDRSGRTPAQQEMFAHTQSLLRLRREYPALRAGKQWHIGMADTFYAYLRETGTDRLLMVFNREATSQAIEIPLADTPMSDVNALEPIYDAQPAQVSEGTLRVTVPPVTVSVYRVR